MATKLVVPGTYKSVRTKRIWWFYEICDNLIVALEHPNSGEVGARPYLLPVEMVTEGIRDNQLLILKDETERFQYGIKQGIKQHKDNFFWRKTQPLWNQLKKS